MDLAPERVGVFDVVLFLGVLYRLPNLLLALERVSSVTKKLLILETVVPNHAAVRGMLTGAGFARVETLTPPRSAPLRAVQAVVHALRGQNGLRDAFRQDRAVFHAYKA